MSYKVSFSFDICAVDQRLAIHSGYTHLCLGTSQSCGSSDVVA